MSNQYPGQPGDLPPTQAAPGGVPPQQPGQPAYPQQGYPQQGYPQQPPPPPTYGAAPGGGGGYPPGGGYPAPPTGGGGKKKLGLVLGILAGVLLLVAILVGVLVWPIGLLTGDDGDDEPKRKVTRTITASATETTPSTDLTTPPTTEVTTETTTEATAPSLDDAEITAQAYLNSLAEGNCLAVQGLSTPEWWQSAYGNERACKRDSGNQTMSTVVYEPFEAPVDNGDGSVTLTTMVSDSTDTSGTTYQATWTLVPSDDGSVWLVDQFELV